MDRQQFREAAHAFVTWSGKFECDDSGHLQPSGEGALASLPVTLNIPRSSKVVKAVRGKFPFHTLTHVYSWRATGMLTGEFAESCAFVGRLSRLISSARTAEDAIAACKSILSWGGDRNAKVGAMPFLKKRPDIVAYLDAIKGELSLETAVVPPSGELSAVLKMNSMLTKVHAFNSDDGLPIYDSRVAGAIATLIETWRQVSGLAGHPLPQALSFPSAGGGGYRRSVLARYPGCFAPDTLHYVTDNQTAERGLSQSRKWASAKVRLGWLLSELLDNPNPKGIRSLEACLFMAGYNCSGINT